MNWEETHLGGLRRRVRAVTRLARVRGALVGLAAAVIAGGGAFIVASAFDVSFWLPGAVRFVLLAGSAALVVYAALHWGGRSVRELGREPRAARAVEERFPEIENTLSTAIEFGSDPEKTAAYSSPEIVETLVRVTNVRTEPLGFSRAVNWRALARTAAAAGALVAAVLVYAVALPQLAGATARRFFAPFGPTPPPTWTVITGLRPGDAEIQRGASQRIEVEIAGRRPEAVKLRYRPRRSASEVEVTGGAEWSEAEMSPLGDERFARTLVNITREIEYRVLAGDAASRVHRIVPYEEPRVESLRVKITPPSYTGLSAEDLPEGTGDVRSLAGTAVEVRVRVTPGIREAALEFTLGEKRERSTLALEPAEQGTDEDDSRELRAGFTLTQGGEYRVRLRDGRGRTNRSEESVIFRLTAVPDRAPKVRVRKPRPDVLAARDQRVTIEIEATDDWGLAEVGIVHTLSGKPERIAVERPKSGVKKTSPEHEIRLGLFGFKGGEIVTYYAYARDTNDVTGPAETTGELRFIRTYGEERYGVQMGEMRTPPAAREIDRLIERQMDVMRVTFDLATRQRHGAVPKQALDEAAADQDDVRRDIEDLLRAIETELDEDRRRGIMPREIVFLRQAEKKMTEATGELRDGRPASATDPQAEALSYLSRTRRIILSASASGEVGRAIESAERERLSHREAQRRRDLDELEQEMRKMPPILEREEEIRRKLERLEDEPPQAGAAGEAAEEQRRLAEAAREQASQLAGTGGRDASFPREPQRKLLEAAEEMDRSASAAERQEFSEAARSAGRAVRSLSSAESAGRRALRSADRERIQGARMQAEELARRQEELAKETRKRSDEGGGMSAQEAAEIAQEQEGLREELEALREETESLAARAEREGSAEADALSATAFREQIAEEEMDTAARALRGARPYEAQSAQGRAVKLLGEVADGLREASRRARSEERQELSRAVERAERLAGDAGELARQVRDPARDPTGLTGNASRLEQEATDIARAVSLIPSRAGKGDIEKAKRSLSRAERELARAGRAMARPDRAGAASSLEEAKREAERAASALRRSGAEDVARALSAARAEARAAARRQEEVRDALAAARAEGDSPSPASRSAAGETARHQAEAAHSERLARENVEAAAETASALGSSVAGLVGREARRGGRERLDERMEEFASKIEEAGGERDAEEHLRRSEQLVKEARAVVDRLSSLFAEARDDEVEALRSLAEDSRRLSGDLRSLDEATRRATGEAGLPKAEEDTPTGERDEVHLRELASRVRGLEDDAKTVRERLERRAPEILEGRTEEGPVGDVLASTERELRELARRLSRNQRPRPTNALGAGAVGYQIVGDGVIEKLEAIMRQRNFHPPEDEVAPEEFRDLVEKYFRALSEDSGN